ncbi:methyltransferase domain-containing protein [Desulfovibrio gilichinskyi]|uniref:Methyltransferase domain-containing protein n=1 Tax=Desulfovibrio gilichinskyi TaxID=1519643 RepID=A0A1X7EJ43_9BACT|nr:methyltransferase domain-containing protein [Desulfovibrio gilichinskyi]SMF34664.1 Methyltransferase domain-containing protein [Desulfovibrio gilichinskyi]
MEKITLTADKLVENLVGQYGDAATARFLLNCLQQIKVLPEEASNGLLDNSGVKTADPRLYGNFRTDVRNTLEVYWDSVACGEMHGELPIMLDIGGGKGEGDGFRKGTKYIVLDFDPDDPSAINLQHDLNKPLPFEDKEISFIYSNQVLEHIEKPWLLAQEIGRVLKPGGVAFISTVFAYRYHPYPRDYWRFTHEGLAKLLTEYACLKTAYCKYELTHRRDDRRGALSSPDEVHIDWLGGFRENWFVYFIGFKEA